jgi:ribose 5-phosphate isomerase B
MKIIFAADHAGFELKKILIPFVREMGCEVEDVGAFECVDDDDYPDFVSLAARAVSDNPENIKAIIIGGSGQGEAIVANRFAHVRAVVFNGQYKPEDGRFVPHEIEIAREHNDANILSLGARFLSEVEAKEAVRLWLTTPFSGDERHVRRIAKIEQYTYV